MNILPLTVNVLKCMGRDLQLMLAKLEAITDKKDENENTVRMKGWQGRLVNREVKNHVLE